MHDKRKTFGGARILICHDPHAPRLRSCVCALTESRCSCPAARRYQEDALKLKHGCIFEMIWVQGATLWVAAALLGRAPIDTRMMTSACWQQANKLYENEPCDQPFIHLNKVTCKTHLWQSSRHKRIIDGVASRTLHVQGALQTAKHRRKHTRGAMLGARS